MGRTASPLSLDNIGSTMRSVSPSLRNVSPSVRNVSPSVRDIGPSVRDIGPSLCDVSPSLRDIGPPLRDVGPLVGPRDLMRRPSEVVRVFPKDAYTRPVDQAEAVAAELLRRNRPGGILKVPAEERERRARSLSLAAAQSRTYIVPYADVDYVAPYYGPGDTRGALALSASVLMEMERSEREKHLRKQGQAHRSVAQGRSAQHARHGDRPHLSPTSRRPQSATNPITAGLGTPVSPRIFPARKGRAAPPVMWEEGHRRRDVFTRMITPPQPNPNDAERQAQMKKRERRYSIIAHCETKHRDRACQTPNPQLYFQGPSGAKARHQRTQQGSVIG